MVIGLPTLPIFSGFRLLLDIGLPAPRLKPVVGKADLGAGETCAVGRVGLDGLQQVLRCDPFLHGLFDLGRQAALPRKAVGRIGGQDLLSLPRLALREGGSFTGSMVRFVSRFETTPVSPLRLFPPRF